MAYRGSSGEAVVVQDWPFHVRVRFFMASKATKEKAG
jgi:hypothetical protein